MITGALWKVGPGVRFGLNWNAKCQIEWELKRRIVRRRQAALSFHSSPKWMLFLYTSKRKENHIWYHDSDQLIGRRGRVEMKRGTARSWNCRRLSSQITGQEQASNVIFITQLFGWLSPCQKWPNTQENGCWCWLPPCDHIHCWNSFLDQTRPRKRNNWSSQSFA